MNKLLEITECMQCFYWRFKDKKDYCKKKKRLIPDLAELFPKWCPLPNANKNIFSKIFGKKE